MLTVITVWIFHIRHFRFVHETGLSIIYGVIAGLIINYAPGDHSIQNRTVFDSEIFFYVLLVPIIFHAGYSLKQRHFFRNIAGILVYALIGTTISTFIFGGIMYWYVAAGNENIDMGIVDCLSFGALISATDPVTVLAIFSEMRADVDLYALMFGESVLNDAVAIVLFRTIASYQPGLNNAFDAAGFFKSIGVFLGIFVGSMAIGLAVAMVTALFMKQSTIKHHPLLETAAFVLLSYSSYLAAEAVGLSGIVSVLFTGMGQAHYTFNNLSEESQNRTKQFFELLNFLAENFVFSYLGLSLFTFPSHVWRPGFIIVSILACILSRMCNVFPLSFVLNLFKKPYKRIPLKFQLMMVWAGLRGAIAFSLASSETVTEAQKIILTTTLMIVLFTVLVFGGGTTMMLQFLKIRVGVSDDDEVPTSNYVSNSKQNPLANHQPQEGQASLVRRFLNFDQNYLKPVFDSRYVDVAEPDTGFGSVLASFKNRKGPRPVPVVDASPDELAAKGKTRLDRDGDDESLDDTPKISGSSSVKLQLGD
ncbi:solute carrier family 9, variant [Capsaspora owczarzaki ATCC 30864]|nr:solute carrier family 9, variant [Capsaspora owczarzaki ATCC 30864]